VRMLVEDEDRIASFVVRGLAAEGHSVEHSASALESAEMAVSRDYDLVLLDLLLPDGNGREVLARIRSAKPDLPVIIVSALGDVDDKVELLDLGADDYMTKPYAMRELSARVRAAARQGRPDSRVLEAGDLTLDLRTRVARRGETAVDLPSREFALLEYLVRHAGQVVTRQQVLDAVWGFDFEPGSNVVDVYIGYLRRKLDTPGEPSFIETVRGAGYRVTA
jgi:DNA-binding response OmpR family regulator